MYLHKRIIISISFNIIRRTRYTSTDLHPLVSRDGRAGAERATLMGQTRREGLLLSEAHIHNGRRPPAVDPSTAMRVRGRAAAGDVQCVYVLGLHAAVSHAALPDVLQMCTAFLSEHT